MNFEIVKDFFKDNWKKIAIGGLGILGIGGLGFGLFEMGKPVTSEGTVQTVSWDRVVYVQKLVTVKESGWEVPKGGRVYDTNWEFKKFIDVPSGKDQNGVTKYKQEAQYATKYYYEIDKWQNDRLVRTNAISDKSGNIVGPYWGEVGELEDGKERIGSTREAYYICIVDNKTREVMEFRVDDRVWNNIGRGDYVRVNHSRFRDGSCYVAKSVEVLG